MYCLAMILKHWEARFNGRFEAPGGLVREQADAISMAYAAFLSSSKAGARRSMAAVEILSTLICTWAMPSRQ